MSTMNPYAPPTDASGRAEPPLVAQLVGEIDGLSVEFEQTFEDVEDLNEFHVRRKRLPGVILLIGSALVVGIFTALMILRLMRSPDPGESLESTGPFLLGGLIFVGILTVLIFSQRSIRARAVRKLYEGGKNLLLTGIRRITITPQFLIFSSPLCQSVHRWQGMEKIEMSPKAIYLYSSSMTAYAIPRRAFATEEQFQRFAQQAQQYLAAA
jgi:hypothetical protein